MERTYDVLCIGLIAADLLVQPVDRGIFDVDTTRIDEIKILPGGDAMNESIVLSRLGLKAGLLGKVGDDQFGDMVLRHAAKNGVDIGNVRVDKNTVTSTSIVLINRNGDRNFVYCAGNNEALRPEDVNPEAVRSARIVNIGSILGLTGLDRGGTAAILEEAAAHGAITSADSSHDVNGLGLEGIKDALERLDFFIPSFGEARYLTDESDPDRIADILLGCGVKNVVIKLGGKGCYIKNSGKSCLIPPYMVGAIDTTGAGDNFVAGFLTGLSKGWPLERCGSFANAVGALSTLEVGANTGVKNMEQVLNFIKNKERM